MRTGESSDCCVAAGKPRARGGKAASTHPDHSVQIKRLNRVIGQLLGVKRMIEERRYCPDILTQTRAAASALKAIEIVMLETHLRHCVAEAVKATNPNQAEKKNRGVG